jgi:DNA helicase-2/ATP-dependent DNA helicase PcrA
MAQLKLLSDLNPSQLEAVQHSDGPVLVLAGAGSGKTRVLTYRIAFILEKGLAKPHEILAVTFTNKAANEMKGRIEELINLPVKNLWIGTFHSISARILHQEARHIGYQSNFSIYDTDDQENQIKRIMEFLNISKEILTPRMVQYSISDAKNKLIDAKQYEKTANDFRTQQIAKIYWEYETALRRSNAFDFDDLIIKPIEIFTEKPEILKKYQNKFKYILVDEYQDTNRAQYYWVRLLAKSHHNICVVGDEDQSIYRWRGADITNILNFEKDYKNCLVIRLEQNYRSTQTILDAANAVVAKNVNRLGKNLWSDKGKGDLINLYQAPDEVGEAYQVTDIIRQESTSNGFSLNDIVILYRTNAQSRVLEEQLRRSNMPYTIVGGMKFYERKEIKDILAYLRILVNPNDAVSLERIINFPIRGIGSTSGKNLREFARQQGITLYEAMANISEVDTIKSAGARNILNFHQQLEEVRKKTGKINAYQTTEIVVDTFNLRRIYENSQQVEDESRLENIDELMNSIEIFVSNNIDEPSLLKYLEEISLLTDLDRWDDSQASVTLMTLHSAKGLEFPVVLITGMEDGLIPLSRNSDLPEELEEERRLFYVGMTRCKNKLYLLNAQVRRRFGNSEYSSTFRSFPSRFLIEIPDDFINRHTDIFPETFESPSQANSFTLERLPDEESDFKIGQMVSHEVFGQGQILGVEKSNLGTKLTVQFENRKIKKLIAEYANLTIRNKLE